jgi:hypothetical protein
MDSLYKKTNNENNSYIQSINDKIKQLKIVFTILVIIYHLLLFWFIYYN